MKRTFDIISSLVTLTIGLPFFILIASLIVIDSKGGIFFIQQRVGKDNKDFEAAIESYKLTISLKPDFAEAHNNLGNVLKEIGRLDEANVSFNKVFQQKILFY